MNQSEIQKMGIERGYYFACKVSVAKIDPDISYNANFKSSIVPDIETAEINFKSDAVEKEDTDRSYHFTETENMLENSQREIDSDVWIIFDQGVEQGIENRWLEVKP